MPKGLIAYELLDVLLPPLPDMVVAWRDMDARQRATYRKQQQTFVRNGQPIYRPGGQFSIITLLRSSEEMRGQLIYWLDCYFPGQWQRLSLLDKSRTHDNILEFKQDTINAWGVEEYWEPDPVLVRELSRACPHTRIRWAAALPREKPSTKIK